MNNVAARIIGPGRLHVLRSLVIINNGTREDEPGRFQIMRDYTYIIM